jgi:hypothetical protein
MPEKQICTGKLVNGTAFCQLHGQKLVDRATAEKLLGKIDQPQIGGALYCPISGSMMSFDTAAHDAIRDSDMEVP